MPLILCPECKKQISDQAAQCPQCGYPLPATAGARFVGAPTIRIAYGRSFQYSSKIKILGLPLLDIATGFDDQGRKRIARGIIAIGDIAFGVLAIGGFALGGVTLGGCSIGAIAMGGLAIGAVGAVGGLAVGYTAVGGCAVGYYAMGGAAFGTHTMSALGGDPEAVEWFKQKLGINFPMMGGFKFPQIPQMPKMPTPHPGKIP